MDRTAPLVVSAPCLSSACVVLRYLGMVVMPLASSRWFHPINTLFPMRSLVALLAIALITTSNAQPAMQWQRCLGGSQTESASRVQQTSDGGYIVVGYTSSSSGQVSGHHGADDVWVVKTDGLGSLEWQKALGGSGIDRGHAIIQTSDGGYLIAATTASNNGDVSGNHGQFDAWVIKLDAGGGVEWDRVLGSSEPDAAVELIELEEGGYLVAGYAGTNDGDVTISQGADDIWVIRLSGSGELLWQRTYGSSYNDWAYGLARSSDGHFLVAGKAGLGDGDVSMAHGGGDVWVIKIDGAGTLLWERSFGGTSIEAAGAIRATSDGGAVVVGYTTSEDGDVSTHNGGGWDVWVLKLGAAGELEWERTLGGSSIDSGSDIRPMGDGGYLLVAGTQSMDGDVTNNHGDWDGWLVKLNAAGVLQWQLALGGSGADATASVALTGDGGCVVAGYTNSSDGDVSGGHGGYDLWLAKFGPDQTDVPERSAMNWSLAPNPTNGQVTIALNDQRTVPVQIGLFDPAGRHVFEHFGRSSLGTTTISIEHLPPGPYQLRLLVDGHWSAQRLVKY